MQFTWTKTRRSQAVAEAGAPVFWSDVSPSERLVVIPAGIEYFVYLTPKNEAPETAELFNRQLWKLSELAVDPYKTIEGLWCKREALNRRVKEEIVQAMGGPTFFEWSTTSAYLYEASLDGVDQLDCWIEITPDESDYKYTLVEVSGVQEIELLLTNDLREVILRSEEWAKERYPVRYMAFKLAQIK